MTIWEICQGIGHIKSLNCEAWRIVEDQTKPATRKLVNSLEEQQILEDLIETVKPNLPDYCQSYHYLLSTPFRYPPLKYGSRFNTQLEPSLWHGSLMIETAMAEKAFYRFAFLQASEAQDKPLQLRYTAFATDVSTHKGIDLTQQPFSDFNSQISSPISYNHSQKLGQQMRECGIEAFSYISARCPKPGINVALFTPFAFKSKNPKEPFQSWQCIATTDSVEFIRTSSLMPESRQFSIDLFSMEGDLLSPIEKDAKGF
jgi:RES domain